VNECKAGLRAYSTAANGDKLTGKGLVITYGKLGGLIDVLWDGINTISALTIQYRGGEKEAEL
jgi:hypothetical protein